MVNQHMITTRMQQHAQVHTIIMMLLSQLTTVDKNPQARSNILMQLADRCPNQDDANAEGTARMTSSHGLIRQCCRQGRSQ